MTTKGKKEVVCEDMFYDNLRILILTPSLVKDNQTAVIKNYATLNQWNKVLPSKQREKICSPINCILDKAIKGMIIKIHSLLKAHTVRQWFQTPG